MTSIFCEASRPERLNHTNSLRKETKMGKDTLWNKMCPKWLPTWPVLREEITCCPVLRLSQHPGEHPDPATAEPEELPSPPAPLERTRQPPPKGGVHVTAGHRINKHHWAIYICFKISPTSFHGLSNFLTSFWHQNHISLLNTVAVISFRGSEHLRSSDHEGG